VFVGVALNNASDYLANGLLETVGPKTALKGNKTLTSSES